jgi:hypothetical protein
MRFKVVVVTLILLGYSYVYWDLPIYGVFNGCINVILDLKGVTIYIDG